VVLNVVFGLPYFERKVLNYNYVAATLQFSPPFVSYKLPPFLACWQAFLLWRAKLVAREHASERCLASPFACCSRVTSRDSPKWRACSQATPSPTDNTAVFHQPHRLQDSLIRPFTANDYTERFAFILFFENFQHFAHQFNPFSTCAH